MKKNILIVGGGLAGIASAIFHAREGTKVTVLEQTEELGGLMRSYTSPEGFSFDYGTHFLRQTGVDDIDKEIFDNLPASDWIFFPYLKCGNFFERQLNLDSPFILASRIREDDYTKGLVEFLECRPQPDKFKNLSDQLVGTFGRTFYEKIHRPLIKKFYDRDPSTLEVDSHMILGLNRILVENPERSRQLKLTSFNDSRLGFHSYREGVSGLKSIYPRTGGIGKWVAVLRSIMMNKGICVQTSVSVNSLQVTAGRVRSAVLSNGDSIVVDKLVWTIPPTIFLNLAKEEYEKRKLTFVSPRVYHLLSNRSPNTDAYYITCHDHQLKTYRVTLHTNCNETKCGEFYPFTVEVISHDHCDTNTERSQILKELTIMNLFDSDARIQLINVEIVRNGIPIPEVGYRNTILEHLSMSRSIASNVSFVGKSTGEKFFMNDVLMDAFQDSNVLY